MALVYGDSFDAYNGVSSTSTGFFSGNWANLGGNLNAFAAGRFGGQALSISDGAGATGIQRKTLDANIGPNFQIHFAHKPGNVANTGTFARINFTGTTHLNINYTATAGVSVSGPGGILITSPNNVIVAGNWHSIELIGTIDNTAGAAELFVDGVSMGSVSGVDTQGGATAAINQFDFLAVDLSGSTTQLYDDWMIGDAAVAFGPSRGNPLRPTADTTQKDFTPLSGLTNFAMVNETLVDGDTTYVFGDTVGQQDLYDCTDLTTTPDTIHGIILNIWGRTGDAAARSISLDIKSGGTTSQGPNSALTSTYTKNTRTLAVNPVTGTPWTLAQVQALQIGQGIRV